MEYDWLIEFFSKAQFDRVMENYHSRATGKSICLTPGVGNYVANKIVYLMLISPLGNVEHQQGWNKWKLFPCSLKNEKMNILLKSYFSNEMWTGQGTLVTPWNH